MSSTGPTIDFLCELFARHQALGELDIKDYRLAAYAFLSLVVGGLARLITAGGKLSEQESEIRIQFSVQLFLNGVRSRPE